jgi:predicted nucleic acid-binding protein
MIAVLDTSAGMEIVLQRPLADRFRQVVAEASRVISSELYRIEAAAVLRKYVKAGLVRKVAATELLRLSQSLVDEFVELSANNEEALLESIRLDHSPYDLMYLTIARRTGATLLTLDRRLAALAENTGISVIGVEI